MSSYLSQSAYKKDYKLLRFFGEEKSRNVKQMQKLVLTNGKFWQHEMETHVSNKRSVANTRYEKYKNGYNKHDG